MRAARSSSHIYGNFVQIYDEPRDRDLQNPSCRDQTNSVLRPLYGVSPNPPSLNSHLIAESIRSAHLGSHATRGISGHASVWSLSGGFNRTGSASGRGQETSPRNPWH